MSPSPQTHRTSVVTVSYKSGSLLSDMLASLPSGTPTLIVNNAPEDEQALRAVVAKQDRITLLNSPENIGFGAACNLGARHATSEFLLFLNPDARLEPACLAVLERAADTYQDAAAFNPAISDDRGRPYFKRGSVLLPNRQRMRRGWPLQDHKVHVLSGAALFVRKAAFDTVGGFDQRIFLYHEDDDLAIRLNRQCGDLMFIRNARAAHTAGHSTPRNPRSAELKAYHMGWSRVYAGRKHARRFASSRALLSAAIQIFNPAVLFSARKRAKQIAFLRGAASAAFQGMT